MNYWGEIHTAQLLAYQRFVREELHQTKEKVKWYELGFDTAYEGLTVVDEYGVIQLFNENYSRFVGVSKEEAIGKKAADVIDNTRLPVVLKTGVPERSQAHRLQGQDLVVHRLPIWKNNRIVGAIGVLVYEGVSEIYQVIERMQKLEEKHMPTDENGKPSVAVKSSQVRFEEILGDSPAISKAKKIARKAAKSKATVLITGESGVGKEQFARAIHDAGLTGKHPFISVNCAAIPENLLESELFWLC
ncbi:sigma 54-interacting transcriptional regulator [Virgibacillus halophilus]|uniref:Sigma 54-interacting transcriptional regulator n=1 Tax=Tigheibacillus halophilus TaxID=361280 RepID=A0ABU5C6M9_9BACI|nr:sigma 54-interacting transcriptional regulator [Virgibacillus halophilus]